MKQRVSRFLALPSRPVSALRSSRALETAGESAAPPLPPRRDDDVLVAAKDLNFGAIVGEADLRWENWPKDHIPEASSAKALRPVATRN